LEYSSAFLWEEISDEYVDYEHNHDEYELNYAVQGKVETTVNGRDYIQEPFSLLLIPAHAMHRWRHNGKKTASKVISFHFEESLLGDVKEELISLLFSPGRPFYYSPKSLSHLYVDERMRELIECRNNKPELREAALRGSLVSFLARIASLKDGPVPAFDPDLFSLVEGSEDERTEAILEFIARRLQDPPSVTELCRKFAISKPSLESLFHRQFGTTPARYIRNQRLASARQAILEGRKPEQAAYAVGFDDYSVFFRAYKALYGTAPSDRNLTAER
jgi:AraC-like DNA-binding protein